MPYSHGHMIHRRSSRTWCLAVATCLALSMCFLSACAATPTVTPRPTVVVTIAAPLTTPTFAPPPSKTPAPARAPTETSAASASTPALVPALDPNRTAIFVSTDMGGDDRVALLYLLSHPEIQVLGIGSSEGLAYLEPGARNALRLLALVGKEHIPVAVGKEGPLEGENAFPDSWRRGTSRPYGSSVPQAEADLVPESTSELLAKLVNAYPDQVTVVILGAHTDVALALRNDPTLAERIKAIHIMGGAVYAPGNIGKEQPSIDNETAEWNLWVDYVATSEVFNAGIPLSMVPLDATDLVRLDRDHYAKFSSQAESPAAKAVVQFWSGSAGGSGTFIWDVVAAVALTLPQAATWETLPIEVVTDEPENLGQTRVLEGGTINARVSVSVDADRILDEITRVLNAQQQ